MRSHGDVFIVIIITEMNRHLQLIALSVAVLGVFPVGAAQNKDRIIAGWLEMIVLHPSQLKLKAKLDSGAKTSSIHAENLEYFTRDDETWVRFNLPKGRSKKAVQQTIEAPLLREVKIKRHNMPPKLRPVVEMSFCIDSRFFSTQFTLADRGNFNYPVLLGRRFLEDSVLIDPASTFLHEDEKTVQFCRGNGIETVAR